MRQHVIPDHDVFCRGEESGDELGLPMLNQIVRAIAEIITPSDFSLRSK